MVAEQIQEIGAENYIMSTDFGRYALSTPRGSAAVDKILVLASREGVAPAAMIFAEVDPVAPLGCIVGRIPAVADIEMDLFEAIESGDCVEVDAEGGWVEISRKRNGG